MQNADSDIRCYICKKSTEEDNKLKTLNETTWVAVKKAASLRTSLQSDKYAGVTQILLQCASLDSVMRYHPSCHKCYTAAKRSKSSPPTEAPQKKINIETRQSSSLPKSDQQGLLKGTYIFCGKSRKKTHGKEEPRLKIATLSGCQNLCQRAQHSKNDRIKSLVRSGVDLIAKEAEYHKSCRISFDKETNIIATEGSKPQTSTFHYYHKCAFKSLSGYIEIEVIQNLRSLLVSNLLELYKAEYTGNGGSEV